MIFTVHEHALINVYVYIIYQNKYIEHEHVADEVDNIDLFGALINNNRGLICVYA